MSVSGVLGIYMIARTWLLRSRTSCVYVMTSTMRNPPVFDEKADYDVWKRDVSLWMKVTEVKPEQQAIVIHLSLTGKARQASSELTEAELVGTGAVKILLAKLDRVFAQDKNWKCFNAYLAFEDYRREPEVSIDDYLCEFDRRYHKLTECDVKLPSAIIACRLLKSCNLSDVHFQLALSTTSEMSFESMRATLKKLFTDIGGRAIVSSASDTGNSSNIKCEPADAFYGEAPRRGRGWRGGYEQRRPRGGYRGRGGRRTNPSDYSGNVSKCFECGSETHWARDCDAKSRNSGQNGRSEQHNGYYGENESAEPTLVSEEVFETKVRPFSVETIGHVVLDSGCSRTVCGLPWLESFLDTLDERGLTRVKYEQSTAVFKFGDGNLLNSLKRAIIPCQLAGKNIKISTDVVKSDIPLLFSKESMKKAEMKIDLVNDDAFIFGKTVKMLTTSSGHYMLPICKDPSEQYIHDVLFSKNDANSDRIALKLHRQFAHPTADKLRQLLKSAGRTDPGLLNSITRVTETCETCQRYRKPRPRPIVSMPMATSFNDTVSADLKAWRGDYFFVLVDMSSRYCQAVVIKNKLPQTILAALYKHWICIFGAPRQFLTDNGGEFSNGDMLALADMFGIKLLNTAAESPWSNGTCERLNAILGTSVQRVTDDTGCSVDVALAWAVSARNSLQNFSGFSPNQLVFGKNPVFPNLLNATPPALEAKTNSEVVADNLNAMNSARRDFIRNESDERIRRALLRQVRDDDPRKFETGDSVYYKRNESDQWRGPARVIGRDGKQILVRHGGFVIRVHACRANHQHLPPIDESDLLPTEETSKSSPISAPVCDDEELDSSAQDIEDPPRQEVVEESSNEISNDQLHRSVNTAQLKVGQRLRFKTAHGDVVNGEIISRAGKVTGKHKNCYNIKQQCGQVGWFDLSSVDQLQEISDSAEVLVTTNSDMTYNAKLNERQSWLENGVYEEAADLGQSTISLRWVVTEKMKNGESVIKARLVARGYEKELIESTDSPTCSKDSLRLSLALISTHGWSCKSVDIRCAFLQGKQINREVFVRPPPEFDEGKLWRLKKSVYGLNDAAKAWYETLKNVILENGMKMCALDLAMFYYQKNNQLSGVLCIHVDDLLFAGTDDFLSTIFASILKRLQIGSTSEKSFKYIGVNLDETEQGIRLHQQDYIAALNAVKLSKEREIRRNDALGTKELESYRALVGQLNWLSTQTRPDISFSVCELSKKCKDAKVNDIVQANKVVKWLKDSDVYVMYSPLKNMAVTFIECFSDASYGNLTDGGSQGGYLIFVSDGATRNLVSWQSRRVRRVVKSTLAAEALALLDAAQAGVMFSHMMSELLMTPRPLVKCCVDNRSLVDALYSTKAVEDKHLRIDVAVLRDMINRGDLSEVSWVQSSRQLANALTKAGASTTQLVAAMH